MVASSPWRKSASSCPAPLKDSRGIAIQRRRARSANRRDRLALRSSRGESCVNCPLMSAAAEKQPWLTRPVLGVGLTSLFSDWSHETATAVLPAFLGAIGAGPAWLGAIEGVADGLSSFAKLIAGHYTDTLKRRKPLAVLGYAVTALRSEEHTSELQSRLHLVCRLLLEKKKKQKYYSNVEYRHHHY